VVRNAATGEPLVRALVRIEGDADTGALTSGDGHFEIPGVAVGPQVILVRKPGFLDSPISNSSLPVDPMIGPAHNVWVTADMPDVVFTLAPTGSIQGQIELSSGDPAQDIVVELARQTVADGRAIWQAAGSTKTSSAGSYHFVALTEGTYAVFTDPAQDSDADSALVEAGSEVERAGYPSVFYPDARGPSGAARIKLRSGEQAQANLALTLEPFHLVTATAALPQSSASTAADRAAMTYSAMVTDTAGHQLFYHAQFDPKTHAIQAALPDGNYSLLVTSSPRPSRKSSGNDADAGPLVGLVDFSVLGHPVTNLRVPVSSPHPGPVQLALQRSETAQPANQNGQTVVLLSLAGGWVDDGMVSTYANGSVPGPLAAVYTLPGPYWVHTHVQKGYCEASFTAGGANLAREPVIIGLSGSSAPMDLTVRDDCASLTVDLPQNLMAQAPGEEPFYTVYIVPDFDSTTDMEPITLRPSTGGSVTLQDLAPGSYHVYMFDAPVRLEYRNLAVLAALPNQGQSVTLSPGATSNLVLEAPGQ
jgi:hypothetical protein